MVWIGFKILMFGFVTNNSYFVFVFITKKSDFVFGFVTNCCIFAAD